MKLDVNMINPRRNSRVNDYTVDRLNLVVGRFHDRLGPITVQIRDENGGKGGEDKTCAIDARLVPRGTLHVAATESDLYAAIHKAVHRLESVVARSVDKGHRGRAKRHRHGGLRNDTQRIIDEAQQDE